MDIWAALFGWLCGMLIFLAISFFALDYLLHIAVIAGFFIVWLGLRFLVNWIWPC